MRRRKKPNEEGPGQDSFLDIVANLVGILIILVMVVGVRAKDAMVQAEAAKTAEPEIDVATPSLAAKALIGRVNEIQSLINTGKQEMKYRSLERKKMLQVVALKENELESEKKKLSESESERLRKQADVDRAKSHLAEIEQQRSTLENATAPTTELKHIPTPLAKTVFGKEVHFRLEGHRIVFVPWDELVDRLKREAPEKFWKLKQAPEFSEVIGPISGFRIKYTIAKRDFMVSTGGGKVRQSVAALDHFLIIPTDRTMGEPVEKAMQNNSLFDLTLQRLRPNRVTLTIWVYPDSFEDFRVLREQLVRRGFVTAGRPMPAHRHIGGAPTGSRSMAQ